MEIINPTGSKRCEIAASLLAEKEPKNKFSPYRRLVLLPIPSFRDGIHVSGTAITARGVAELVDGETLVAGYGLAPIVEAVGDKGRAVLDLSKSEEFLAENTELTSHATLSTLLAPDGKDVADMRLGIVGYGRLGESLSRHLLFLGARPAVFSGSEEKRSALNALGVECLGYDAVPDTELDILINTAPQRLFESHKSNRFIDLASGGFYASLGAVALPSLPERYYPISSARLYAKLVIDYYNLH